MIRCIAALLGLTAAAIPAPTVQEYDIAHHFSSLQGLPDFPATWTAVGADSSSGFTTAYADYFLCKISAAGGYVEAESKEVGLYNLKLGFCHKTTNALDHEIDAVPPTSHLDENAAGNTFQCPPGFFIDTLKIKHQTQNQGFKGLRWMCRNPTTLELDYSNGGSGWYHVGFSSDSDTPRLDSPSENEDYYICGMKVKRHSIGDNPGDTVGILGVQILRCKFCQNPPDCFPSVTKKFKAGADGKIPNYIYGSGIGQDTTQCMDFSSEDGDILIGGTAGNAAIRGGGGHGVFPFIGMKSAQQSIAGNEWKWLRVNAGYGQMTFENCKFTPVIPYTGKRYIVANVKVEGANIRFYIIDPYAQGGMALIKELETNLMGRNVVSGNEPAKDIRFVSTATCSGTKLQVVFIRPDSSGTKIQMSRILHDTTNGAFAFYYTTSSASAAATDWGSAVVLDSSSGSYYFGTTHRWDSSNYATTLFRYLPQDSCQADYDIGNSIDQDGYGVKMSVLNQPISQSSMYTVGGMDYQGRLMGMAYKKIVPGTVDEVGAQTGSFLFFGECARDDFYTLEVVSGAMDSFNSQGLYAVSSTVAYAVASGFSIQTIYQAAHLTFKFEFNPDPANCASKGYLTLPKVGMYHATEGFLSQRFDSTQVRFALYEPGRQAIFYLGTTNHYQGENVLQQHTGFILSRTLDEIEAGVDYNFTITTTKKFEAVQQTSFTDKFPGPIGSSDGNPSSSAGFQVGTGIWTARELSPTSCATDIKPNPSTAYIAGYQKELILNTDPAAIVEVPLTEFFTSTNPAACPITYELRAAHPDHPYRADLHAHQLRKDACKYRQGASPHYELTATHLRLKPHAKVNLSLLCIAASNAADIQVSELFHFIVDDFYCRAVPITAAASPASRTLSHYVSYSLDGVRTPTDASNVTTLSLNLLSEGLVTFANNAECPLAFNVSEVLRNDSVTVIPPTKWGSIISIDASTGVLQVAAYGAIEKELFVGARVKVGASNRDQSVIFSALELTVEEEVGQEINEPPYFTRDLEDVKLEAVIGGPNPTTRTIQYTLPPISDVNGDRLVPTVALISPLMSHFVEFNSKYNSFSFKLGELKPVDATFFSKFSLTLKLEDHRGLAREYSLRVQLKATVILPEEEEENQVLQDEQGALRGASNPTNSTSEATSNTTSNERNSSHTTGSSNRSESEGSSGSSGGQGQSLSPSKSRSSFIGIVIPDESEVDEREQSLLSDPNKIIEIVPLKAILEEITTLGKVTITFNQAIVPIDLGLIDDSVLFLQVEPGPYQLPENFDFGLYAFEWEPIDIDYTFNKLMLQLNFTTAEAISQEPGFQDRLRITVRKRNLFRSKEFGLPLHPRKRTMRTNIKLQMPNTFTSRQFDSSTEQTREALSAMTLISLVLSLVFQSAMKKVLDTILSLQVLIHMFLFTIQFPANVGTFVQKLKPLASFNIVRSITQYTITYVGIDLEGQSQVRDEIMLPAQDMGITQHNSISNLGNVFHMELAYFGLLLMFIPLGITSLFSDRVLKRTNEVKKKIFFGELLQILTSGFIAISLAVYLQLKQPMDTTFGERLGVNMAWVSAALLFGFLPLAVMKVIIASKEQLEDPQFQQKWGALYKNMRYESRLQRAFKLVFLLRRFMVLVVGFILNTSPPLQILLINVMNLAVALYQGLASPFLTAHEARMDLLNEFLSVVVTYHLFLFTDILPDKTHQYAGGWSAVSFLALMVGINGYFVLKGMLRNLYLLLFKTLLRCRRRQSRGESKKYVTDFYSQSQTKRSELLKTMSRSQMQDLFLGRSEETPTPEDGLLQVSHNTRPMPWLKVSKQSSLSIIQEESIDEQKLQGKLELYSAIYHLRAPVDTSQVKTARRDQASRVITINVEPEVGPEIFHPPELNGDQGTSAAYPDAAGDQTNLSQKEMVDL